MNGGERVTGNRQKSGLTSDLEFGTEEGDAVVGQRAAGLGKQHVFPLSLSPQEV